MRPVRAIVLVLLFGAPAAAQSVAGKYVGRPIEDLQVYIEATRSQDPALLDLVEARPGQPLSMGQVRESIAHLHSLGRFQDIQVVASDAPGGGVLLRFDLVPVHTVQRVEFEGNLALSEGVLRGAVSERHGPAPPIGRADDVARTLVRVYEDHGYLRAQVRPVPVELHDPDRMLLTFEIDAGPRALVESIDVRGNPGVPEPEFLRRLKVARGDAFRRPELQESLDRYIADLHKRGFYRATSSLRAQESPDRTAVALTINVDAGPVVSLVFEGDPLPESRRKELVPVEREGSLEEDLLEDSEARIESYLRQQGYWKAEVTRREESDGGLRIVFDVRRGMQYWIANEVEIRGNQAISAGELRSLAPLEPGKPFVEAELTAAASRIRALYLERGFVSVDVKSAANEINPERPGEGRVQPAIVIVEGPRTVVGEVRLVGNSALAETVLRARIPPEVSPGRPVYDPHIIRARDAILLDYLDEGFASASVVPRTAFSADRTRADIVFAIEEGPQTIVDHILIVGNEKTDPDVILGALAFRSGDPLGFTARLESQRQITALGLFRRVRITELTHGTGNRHDILITVEEAAATTIGYGGGVEAAQRLRATGPGGEAEEHMEFAPRGFFDIGRRNLAGRNQSINLYTRVSLRPNDEPDDPERDGTGIGFSEYRVVGTYRAPRALGNDFTVTAAAEQGIRSSFNFSRRGVNADLQRQLSPTVRINARYSFSSTRRFDERLSEDDQATIDRLFPQVRLSGISGALSRDTRDELLDPERGSFVSAEGALALRSIGGQVGFAKTYLQGFWFRRLPGRRRIVFATRAAVGLADGFAREAQTIDADGNPVTEIFEDLPASERFFAGGDTSIRGYALDSVGAPGTISPRGFPTGGNAVLVVNGELRLAVWRDIGAAVFVDGGNVFRRVTQFDFGELRGAVGFGVRYNSPIGPIRVDLGFKLDRREIAGSLEPRTALHFSLGQAF